MEDKSIKKLLSYVWIISIGGSAVMNGYVSLKLGRTIALVVWALWIGLLSLPAYMIDNLNRKNEN